MTLLVYWLPAGIGRREHALLLVMWWASIEHPSVFHRDLLGHLIFLKILATKLC